MNAPFTIHAADARTRSLLRARWWARQAWWQTPGATLLLILLAVVPLLYPVVPPLVDLPGHMGRYRVELDLAQSPELRRHFTFAWAVIGNLGVDLLIIPLSKLLGLELATKLIVACIPPLTVAGFLAVAREVHGRVPATALFALPLAYNHAFQFGFVNFALSMALCFLAFAFWLRLGRQERFTLRAWLFAPIGLGLFFVHAFGWATFCLLAFSSELVRNWRGWGHWITCVAAAVRNCLVLGLPLLPLIIWRGNGTGLLLSRWFDFPLKTIWLAGVFRDRWMLLDLVCAMILLVVLVQARSKRGIGFAPPLLVAAGFLTAAFFALPWKVLDSAYADARLAPYLLATALLAISFKEPGGKQERIWAWHGAAFFGAVLLARTISFGMAAEDQQRQFAALDKIPIGARVVTLAGLQCNDSWALPRHSHYAGMVIVRRDGFSNDQWIIPGTNLLGVHDADVGAFDRDPSQIVTPNECPNNDFEPVDRSIASIPTGWFDYLWLIETKPKDARLLSRFQKVWQSGDSALYKLR